MTAAASALALVAPLALVAAAWPAAAAATTDLARVGTATADRAQDDVDGRFPADLAVDGDPATRWASGNGPDADVEFTAALAVDLGTTAAVERVQLVWEAAFAARYEVQVATGDPADPAAWTTVHTQDAGDGGTDDVVLAEPVDARHVRVQMLERTSFDWDPARPHWYGYSLFALEVHGTPAQTVAALGRTAVTVPAGGTASVPVLLNAPAADEVSVRVRSTGGTATAGSDYTAVDERVTFAPGETSAAVDVATLDRGPLAPVRTVELTLDEPSDGLVLGGRTAATVTITPHGSLPDVGATTVLEDFTGGVPGAYLAWGSRPEVTPTLATAAGARDGAADDDVLVATVGGDPGAGDWFGFTHDLQATDWSAHDGFTFWFLGTGSGGTLRYELKSGGQLFETSVVDDADGWRRVSVPFASLRLKGDPASDARFDPTGATGWAITLTDLGAGEWRFDDLALYDRLTILEDVEGDVPIAEPGSQVGLFTWGSDGAQVSLEVQEQDRDGAPAGNHVLGGEYLIPGGGWGGFSQNLAAPQDWSSYEGLRLLWYASQETRPASPTAGADIKVELKDGGPDGEHSEVWAATFKDTWSPDGSRWNLVEIPFSAFTLSGYQPGDEATRNGALDLTSSWGYAITFVPGLAEPEGWALDDVGLYGAAVPPATAQVVADPGVVLVDPGGTAQLTLRLTTTGGAPLPEDVTVTWEDVPGTAERGTHYTAPTGSTTFPAGTASGATATVEVATLATAGQDDARSFALRLVADGAAVGDDVRVVLNAVGAPYLDASRPTAERVEDLLGRMTLAEKVGQMTQAERLGLRSPTQVAELGLGSVLSGGGSVPRPNTAAGWADMVDGFQREALSTRLQIPLVYGVDAVHGHNNVVGATIFPHNQGLGATRDRALVEAVARATAVETRATGVPWTFAPCLCVTRDERWGRSYEAFGEDPALVAAMAAPAVEGLQGSDPADLSGPERVLATAKHWVGDGGTRYEPSQAGSGYPIDQGVTHVEDLEELRRVHVDPYLPALAAGVGSIMPSYSAVAVAGGEPLRMHEHRELNTDLLKDELGFDGFLVSDWEGIDKLPGGTYREKVVRAVDAGLDMAMAPYNFAAFVEALTGAVQDGDVDEARVDDAVRRVLAQKFALGLFDEPFADRSRADAVGGAEHRAIARDAVARSQVLLKDASGVLPLARDAHVYVAGSNADDLGHQSGGWTIKWQGASGDITEGTTVLEGIRAAAPGATVTHSPDASAPLDGVDVGVVVVGEPPYAEGVGDVGNNGRSLTLPAADRAAIDRVCGAVECVVLVVAGRPQLVTDQLDGIDALVASWLPGTEGAGVADVLFGARPFTGRLPVSWPASADQVPVNVGDEEYDPLFAYGWGLRTDPQTDRLGRAFDRLPEGAGRAAIQAVLDAPIWDDPWEGGYDQADLREGAAAHAVPLLARAAEALGGSDRDVTDAADAVVSVVRDLAQSAVVAGTAPADAEARTADAEHALLAGRPAEAVALLAPVVGVPVVPVVASSTTLRLTPVVTRVGQGTVAHVVVRTDGATPTGTVRVHVGGRWGSPIGHGVLQPAGAGRATARVVPYGPGVGRHELVAVYRGGVSAEGAVLPSESAPVRLTVLRAVPRVTTDGTDWSVAAGARPQVHVQVRGPGLVEDTPSGEVHVHVNGRLAATGTLDRAGRVTVELPAVTRTSTVLVTYAGDRGHVPWAAAPRVLRVR